MSKERTEQALAAVDAASVRRPLDSSVNVQLQHAEAACGFSGTSSLWFDNIGEAFRFLIKDLPYLHPEWVDPNSLIDDFEKVGRQYADREINSATAFERLNDSLQEAPIADDGVFSLLLLTNFHEFVNGTSNEAIAARFFFRSDDHDLDDDCPSPDDPKAVPIREDEMDEFKEFLVGFTWVQ